MCGTAEKADDYSADMALIEKVENRQTKPSAVSAAPPTTQQSQQTNTSTSITINTNRDKSDVNKELNGEDNHSLDKTNSKHDKKEDNDSAMDTSEATNSKHENGLATPTSEALSSPPTCNGNHSDTDSLLTEPKKPEIKKQKLDNDSELIERSVQHSLRNGYINGLEKMIENISDDAKAKTTSNPHAKLGN